MGYCTRANIRYEEGLTSPPDGPSDPRVDEMIDLASSLIDDWTGWWFEPRSKTYLLDGGGDNRSLRFPAPVISITSIKRLDSHGNESHTYDADDFVVYNRHLSGGPDDRRDPRVEYQQEGPYIIDAWAYRDRPLERSRVFAWPLGQQNIKVEGVFGYTDYDEGVTPNGITPPGIVRLCRLLVLRVVWPMYSHADKAEEADRRRIVQEKTRDQSWQRQWPWSDALASTTGIGMWTGDPEIDRLIKTFQRPMGVAAI